MEWKDGLLLIIVFLLLLLYFILAIILFLGILEHPYHFISYAYGFYFTHKQVYNGIYVIVIHVGRITSHAFSLEKMFAYVSDNLVTIILPDQYISICLSSCIDRLSKATLVFPSVIIFLLTFQGINLVLTVVDFLVQDDLLLLLIIFIAAYCVLVLPLRM